MDPSALARNYAAVKASLPPYVTLVAVSKTRTVEEIQALYDLGHRDFGENYPQELREKRPFLPEDIRWHFVGHLQRNKVKYILPFVHLVHGVDSESLLDELQKRALALGRTLDILLQVHIAQEETKHGFSPGELEDLLTRWELVRRDHIRVRGLMGMASLTEDQDRIRSEMEGLYTLFRTVGAKGPFDPGAFSILSMGMSSDVEVAVAAGSTMVRIGTAVFGARRG
ncbi:MAG: YggS family pyridoxal phosphate-dependent enzyme [Flavobacteriales bacterium]|nr:YggS family pyridoxal phosphate-dependent enzyme [Flavobacteriales bacterium]MBP6697677.1 YggS family pyridoxal phosphate-dependent enzyme [Flavobacteriales bacterium]